MKHSNVQTPLVWNINPKRVLDLQELGSFYMNKNITITKLYKLLQIHKSK